MTTNIKCFGKTTNRQAQRAMYMKLQEEERKNGAPSRQSLAALSVVN